MLFIEHSLNFLRYDGKLGFILDISLFETAYKYTRKYLLDNCEINYIKYNISKFDVASGQVILKATKKIPIAVTDLVTTINEQTGEVRKFNQYDWYQKNDDFRFRISESKELKPILSKIKKDKGKTLKELYHQKNLRTCAMLLDMEDQFVFEKKSTFPSVKSYPYYRGAKSLKEKFGCLQATGFFYYDKQKQDEINEKLKKKLTLQGIKNKKRIGLGEEIIYDLPKIYIRQSAKTIIATYDELPSAANNSLYVFSLRSCSESDLMFLRFLCAYLNSDLLTFFCQQMQIIRYYKGKQPQIKTSDLYTIPIPLSKRLQTLLANLVHDFYTTNNINMQELLKSVNFLIYNYYDISDEEQEKIIQSISTFQSS